MEANHLVSDSEFVTFDAEDILCNDIIFDAGAGGFGNVVFGYCQSLACFVAVKIFQVTGGERGKRVIIKKIKEEMGHLQKAKHSNIVVVHGWVKWSFAMGIVMEYCEGGNLLNLLLDHDISLPLILRVGFLMNVADALVLCHNLSEKRLIHGDVKLENALITKRLLCKLGDFGSAELATLSNSTTVNSLARSKKERPQYTPHYAAPEKLKDPTIKPTKEFDIYALGVMTYSHITRTVPYPSNDKVLVDAIKEGRRPNCEIIEEMMSSFSDSDRAMAEALVQLMKQCWDQDPSSRPTMDEVSARLHEMYDQYDPDVIRQHEFQTISEMDIDILDPENHTIPIYQFSTVLNRFSDSRQSRTNPQSGPHPVAPDLDEENLVPARPAGMLQQSNEDQNENGKNSNDVVENVHQSNDVVENVLQSNDVVENVLQSNDVVENVPQSNDVVENVLQSNEALPGRREPSNSQMVESGPASADSEAIERVSIHEPQEKREHSNVVTAEGGHTAENLPTHERIERQPSIIEPIAVDEVSQINEFVEGIQQINEPAEAKPINKPGLTNKPSAAGSRMKWLKFCVILTVIAFFIYCVILTVISFGGAALEWLSNTAHETEYQLKLCVFAIRYGALQLLAKCDVEKVVILIEIKCCIILWCMCVLFYEAFRRTPR